MSRRFALRGLAAALLLAACAAARAQQPGPFALQTYEPPPAGDRFLTVSGTGVPDHLAPAAALVLSAAADPLVLRVNGQYLPGGTIVHRQLWAYAQGSVGISGRVLLEATLPMALSQSGSRPLTDLPQVTSSALGDLRLGARLPLPRFGPLTTAVAAELWLPTGSQDAFASDGSPRFGVRAVAAGESGHVEYGGQLGLLWRSSQDLVATSTGSAVTWAVAAAWREGAWRAGPELYGRYQFAGQTTSPAEALLAGHWSHGWFDTALAFGTQLNHAPGAAPYRVVARLSWSPPSRSAAGAAARLAADKAARDQAAVQQVAAEQASAEKAAAEEAVQDRAAREAAAVRAAAEKAAAEEEALDRAAREAASDRAAAEAALAVSAAAKLAAQPAVVKLTAEKIEILQAVQFELNSDALRPVSTPILQQVAWVLQAHPEISRVLIEGHSDSQGDRPLNVKLSEARARKVMAWLVKQGQIAPARLEAVGHGPDRPVASNQTAEGRALNRRVEFKIEGRIPAS